VSSGAAPGMERALVALRRHGRSVGVEELARRLFAVRGGVAPALARRLVRSVLVWEGEELPDPLAPEHLRGPRERRVAAILLEGASWVVVDLETTGLGGDAEILEVGAVRIRAGRLADAFVSLARPEGPLPRRISALTGIDALATAGAPPLAEVMERFRRWLDASPCAPFVAHNAGFDSRFVAAALDRFRLRPLGVPVLCTRRLARRLAPEIGRYDLDHVCAHFGVSNPGRHRALGDARATGRVLVELLARATGRGLRTLGDLMDLQERRPARRR
jgi:DNA polymerase III epsilon subunit family exonuclease